MTNLWGKIQPICPWTISRGSWKWTEIVTSHSSKNCTRKSVIFRMRISSWLSLTMSYSKLPEQVWRIRSRLSWATLSTSSSERRPSKIFHPTQNLSQTSISRSPKFSRRNPGRGLVPASALTQSRRIRSHMPNSMTRSILTYLKLLSLIMI